MISLQRFFPLESEPGMLYTDNSCECTKSLRRLGCNHDKSTPHRSVINGFAKRAVSRANEGTSTLLVQSGSDAHWWGETMEHYCYFTNNSSFFQKKKKAEGKTLFERRCDTPFRGPTILFGSRDILSSNFHKRQEQASFINTAQRSSNVFSLDLC